ncbi:MAG: molybdochelatase MogA, involved in Moco biosynthesis, partial [Pseudomonadota bacterium]
MKNKFTKIGLISISDRASKGEYEDQGIPNLKSWLQKALSSPFETIEKVIPDEKPLIESTLINFVDIEVCDL